MRRQTRHLTRLAVILLTGVVAVRAASAEPPRQATLGQLVKAVRETARVQAETSGMRLAFKTFTAANGLSPDLISYSDFTVVRLLFESTRDAGLWNLQWTITNLEPNSDKIWQQWANGANGAGARTPSVSAPTALAECDELSALFAFLARQAGVKDVGLFWPASNHTVAVWTLRPRSRPAVRVVVPTTQIFLESTDLFGTRKFDPWQQRNIYEYIRRDAPDSQAIPAPLFEFFLAQMEKYGGASDLTLQRLRYLREGVFQKRISREQAAASALSYIGTSHDDGVALRQFAQDMKPRGLRTKPDQVLFDRR